jgi:hypothetical protein
MTDPIQEGAGGKGEPGDANPNASQQPSGQLLSGLTPEAVVELAKALQPHMQETAVKAAQSVKDRRISGLEELKVLTPLVEQLQKATEAAGGDMNAGLRSMQMEALLNDQLAPESPGSGAGTTQATEAGTGNEYRTAITAQILTDYGVAFDDPEYLELVSQYREKLNNEEWKEVAERFGKRRKKQASNNSPSGLQNEMGQNNVHPDDVATAKAEMLDARGQGSAKGREIREKWAKKGVHLVEVDFLEDTMGAR